MTSFVTLYRGETVAEAKIVALSADPALVAEVAGRLLQEGRREHTDDPVLSAMQCGKRRALRLIRAEGDGDHAA